MKNVLMMVVGLAAGVAMAGVSNLQITRLPEAGMLRVSYQLDAPAVVTMDVTTNGAPVEAARYSSATGAVFSLVKAGTATFDWMAGNDLAGLAWQGKDAKIEVKCWATNAPPDWMVVDIAPTKEYVKVRYYERQEQIPGKVTDLVYRKRKMIFRKVPAANVTWRQGAPNGELGGGTGTRLVTLTEDYYLGIHMMTVAQSGLLQSSASPSASIKPATGNYNSIRGNAAADMSWPAGGHVITNTASRLYKIRSYTQMPFDMPTEAQWEFACRAGEKAALYTGEELTNKVFSANLDDIAWYYGNWGSIYGNTAKDGYNQLFPDVGCLKPNAWGFYDMLGLAYEWCLDWHGDYGATAVSDPKGPASNADNKRVLRGGAMDQRADCCRSGMRTSNKVSNGLFWGGEMHVKDGGTCVQNFTVRLCLPAIAYR